MSEINYSSAPIRIRPEIERANQDAWKHIASPGSWWTGAERVAIAAETRAALDCALCKKRKAALSANMVQGSHDSVSNLPAPAIEAIHRIRTDSGRLSESWIKGLMAAGLSEGAYVELAGVLIATTVVDSFHRGLGLPLAPLPKPVEGKPSGYIPQGLEYEGAWVRTIPAAAGLAGADKDVYFPEMTRGTPHVPFVNRGLSQVPEEIRNFARMVKANYIPLGIVGDVAKYPQYLRALDTLQTELVASRVSALNGCFYCTTAHSMILRVEDKRTGNSVNMQAVVSDVDLGDAGVKHGSALVKFVNALKTDWDKLPEARKELRSKIGDEGLVDAAAAAATFEGFNRIADSAGIQLDPVMAEFTGGIRERLGLNSFNARTRTEQ